MKHWVSFPVSAALMASLGLGLVSSVASAQPRPPPPVGVGIRPPPPGVGVRVDFGERARLIEEQRMRQRDIDRRNAVMWENTRIQRELEHRRALESVWGADFYHRPEARVEIALDAERTAKIARIIDIATDAHDAALIARAQRILARENARHYRAMTALRIQLGYR